MRASLLALFAIAVLFGPARGARADEARVFELIVNPKNPATSADRDQLRGLFLKKTPEWSNGLAAHPIDLRPGAKARDEFTRDVLHKTPAQVRSYWAQQIFSGKGVPPPEVEAPADVVTYVLAHDGGVGYVPVGTDVRGVRVIELR